MATALEAREVEVVAELDRDDKVAMDRFERFLKLEFTVAQAEKLAMLRVEDGTFLYHGDVKRLYLDRGCDTATAFDILI